MKKIILFSLFPLLTFAQAVNNHVSKVVLPSPDALSLGKYGEIPVDNFTGIHSVPVAIYNIKAGPIGLSISLTNHSSGLRPAETATWVGHGWNLFTGGIISRTVQGTEDEYSFGYLSQGNITTYNGTCFNNPNFDQPITSMANGQLDGEPDIFSYSVGSLSGKFYLNADGVVIKIPENDVKITYTLGSSPSDFNRLRQFVVTNTDGTKYVFGESLAGYKAIELTYINNMFDFKTASAWKLVRIESADGNYFIDLNYTSEVYSYGSREKNGTFGGGNNSFNKNQVEGHRLTSITSSTGREVLNFISATTPREDVFGLVSNGIKTTYSLERIEIQTGSFCKKFIFDYQYALDNTSAASTVDTENKKRLILNSVQEKSCDNTIVVPAHVFEYEMTGGYLPHKLTAGTDHLGFYNGAENNKIYNYNIPLTELSFSYNGFQTRAIQGGSDKNSYFNFAKLGVLKKVVFPTGGNSSFEYENNQVYDTQTQIIFTEISTLNKNSCSANDFTTVEYTINESNIGNVYLNWNLQQGCPNCSTSYYSEIRLVGAPGSQSEFRYKYLNCDNTNNNVEFRLADLFSNLQNNTNYTLRLRSYFLTSSVTIKRKITTSVTTNINVGGIRTKKITHHDGINTAKDIVKNYDYSDPSNPSRSSGVLYNKPLYGYVYELLTSSCGGQNTSYDLIPFFFDNSWVPMTSFEGHTVVYKHVKEITSGAGYRKFEYFTPTYTPASSFPVEPAQPRISTGNLKLESNNLSVGTVLSSIIHTEKIETLSSTNVKIFVKAYWAGAGLGGSPVAVPKIYFITTKPFRLASVENHKDGLTTTTNLTYRNDKEHLLPIQTETSHSDGTVEKQTIKYAKELNQTDLLSRHMIGMPLESQSFVNNVLTGGQKTNFSLFSAFPRPQTIQTFNTVLSTWETEATFNSYDAFGNPSSVTLRGWQPETYTWNKDLMTQKNYLAFQWKYEYETNTALLKKYTEPNSLFTTYSYDALSRLSTVNQYSGKAITGLSYAYSPANNTIGISTNYATGADLSTQKIIDGLGRNIKIRKIGYGQGGQDVVSQTDFDPAGRVKKEFLPGFTNPSTAFTEYTYEDSPLGRPIAITRPAPLGVETMGYSIDGDFFVETLTNALGEYTKTYTDTRGRKAGTISGKGSLTNTTYNFYDDRNNLIKVRPDGRGDADTDYIYTYTYDGRNRLTSKKIPEKALIEMAYDLRDLPTHSKDGIHPPIYAGYDDYGRNIFSGTAANMSSTAIIDTLAKTDFITNPFTLGFGQPYKNKVAVFGANGQPNGQFILSETQFFDSYHRPIYTRSNHILDLVNPSAITNTFFYNARDQINSQAEGVAVNGINYSISQSHTYDNGGRKTKTEVSFENILNKNIEETTAFDALDKPLQTKIGGNLQTLDYQYFAGGFLDKINGGTTGAGGLALTANGWPSENSSNDLFAMDLDYLANGNISNWKQQNRGFALQNYAYQYDALQRITDATNSTHHQAYSYKDALGNFNGIFRNDLVKTNGNWALQNIDDNAYFYGNPLSSKISSILDYTGSQLGYKANSGTYAYDANGNTTYDPANKVSTLYNYLNLPSKFTKDDGTKQELVYDFSGRKWQVKEFNNSSSLLSTHSYIGSFEFEGNSLSLVHHGRGFIKNLKSAEYQTGIQNGNMQGSNIVSTQKIGEGKYEAENQICLLPGFEATAKDKFSAEIKTINPQYQWQYALSDHLGNLRVIFTDKNNDGLIRQSLDDNLNEVLSFRNYSPFGLELGGSHKNLDYQNGYKFGGKEHNNFTNYIDFGRRNFDASLGRFTTQDRFSEKYFDLSSMGYAAGKPISLLDINGDSLDVYELLKSKTHAAAFALFATSRDGKSWLDQYASKGQKVVINGKLIYESTANGNLHSKGINLHYTINNSSTRSFTDKNVGEGKLDLIFSIAQNGFGSDSRFFNLTKSITHESFIHGELFSADFTDDSQLNESNLGEYKGYNINSQHFYISRNYDDKSNLWKNKGFRVLKRASEILNLNMTDNRVKNIMWSFGGSLIDINEKTGVVTKK
ncbi:MAG: hypothetical protein CFE22_07150 [Cytophagaceae bacterium BCCC1]|nr:MAG: hypothetical protein CFE22_07150 [Cytophagaceae bacterium BCCC1]